MHCISNSFVNQIFVYYFFSTLSFIWWTVEQAERLTFFRQHQSKKFNQEYKEETHKGNYLENMYIKKLDRDCKKEQNTYKKKN